MSTDVWLSTAVADRSAALGSTTSDMAAALDALATRKAELSALLDGVQGLSQRLTPILDRNEGTKIIFKNPGATEGLTDLPLHNDCGLGYHPVACPMVLVGVQLDNGTPESGQLHTFFQLPLSEYTATGGSRTARALHTLMLHPEEGLVVWLWHLNETGRLDARDGAIHFLDAAT